MVLDRERELTLRLDRQAKCANPFCGQQARVAGEFCPSCSAAQQRTREELRRNQSERGR